MIIKQGGFILMLVLPLQSAACAVNHIHVTGTSQATTSCPIAGFTWWGNPAPPIQNNLATGL
jgi:hypothetical protein